MYQWLCLLLGLALTIAPQTRAQQVVTTPNGGVVRLYTDQDGFPGNRPGQLVQTADGYLWIATDQGITRFNGYEFETVGKEFGVPELQAICYDRRREHLWFASPEALVHYDGKTFRRYTSQNGYKLFDEAKSISQMTVDSRGTLWIGAQKINGEGGLAKFENGVFNVLNRASFPLPNMSYPLNNVDLIYESTDGTLWFGGRGRVENGVMNIGACLARYRRESGLFEVMDASKGFPFEGLFGIDEDADGRLWFFCRGKQFANTGSSLGNAGVAVFNGNSFQTFADVQARLTDGIGIRSATLHKPGNEVYVSISRGTEGVGLTAKETESSAIKFSNGKWETVKIADASTLAPPAPPTKKPRDVQTPEPLYAGYRFISGADGTLYAQLWPTEGKKFSSKLNVYGFSNSQWKFIDALDVMLWTRAVFLKNETNLLRSGGVICSPINENGFGIFFPSDAKLFSAQNGLLKETPASFFVEKKVEGNVWVIYHDKYDNKKGQYRADGVSVWDGKQFTTLAEKNGLTSNAVNDGLLQDSKGRIWLPTDKGVTLAEYADESKTDASKLKLSPIIQSSGKPFRASHVLERSNGEIWTYQETCQPAIAALNSQAISFFLGKLNRNRFEPQPNPFPDSLKRKPFQRYSMNQDSYGTLWLFGKFLDKIANDLSKETAFAEIRTLRLGDSLWRLPPKEWEIPNGRIRYAASSFFGDYFFVENDLFVFNLNKFRKVAVGDELSLLFKRIKPSLTLDRAETKGDTVYASFWGHGVLEITPTRARFFQKKNGLPTQEVAARRVANGNVFFASSRGTIVYNGKTFQVVKDVVSGGAVATDIAVDKNGVILACYPEKGITATKLPNDTLTVQISALRADSTAISIDKPAVLPYAQNSINVSYVAPSYRAPENTRYKYRLDGYDDEWSDYTAATSAAYKNLSDGEYAFRVKALSPSGSETSEATFRFVIEPPYWKRQWFVAASIAFIVAFGFAGYQWRVKDIETKNRELSRLVAKRTQEIEQKTEELEAKSRDMQALSEIGQKITAALNLDTLTSTVFGNVNQLMDADAFGIGIYNDKASEITYKSFIDMGVKLPPFKIEMSDIDRPAVWCVAHKKEVFINNFEKEYSDYVQKLPEPRAAGQPKSLLFCPLIVESRVSGVITVQSYKAGAYAKYHLDILKTLASYTAIALDNANAYESLNQAVVNLKEAQTQLVHAEKMASLGELMAGIAHEIQNPLNFVNNFSDVSKELFKELSEELEKTSISTADKDYINGVIADLSGNMEKIAHHGKRASGIVRGMLDHSRKSSGEKQETDINALLDEYLKIAYHGYRAKDQNFNAKMTTEFDESLPQLLVAPQDLSRVFLNVFNNGFYSAYEKAKECANGFMPEISVKTTNLGNRVQIRIRDNGKGIPPDALSKIFQPFFTTKPTGQGTGLGLSISYDIITKQHGGDLKVETLENEFAEFIITLPQK